MLHLGALRLLLPQAEIATLEPEEEVDMSTPHTGAVGAYQSLPVFVLSERLDELVMDRTGRPICALFDAPGHDDYVLLCSEVKLLPAAGLDFKPVPAAMREQDPAVLGIALDEAGLLCLTSAAALRRLIVRLGGFWDDASEAA